jgi:carbonic anhydrase/acetyltransferase-like protein (isoleucine patch superfamily)
MPNFIAQNATVVGKVSIGKDSSVWYLAVIRADVEEIIIGKRTNIQDGAILQAHMNFVGTKRTGFLI